MACVAACAKSAVVARVAFECQRHAERVAHAAVAADDGFPRFFGVGMRVSRGMRASRANVSVYFGRSVCARTVMRCDLR